MWISAIFRSRRFPSPLKASDSVNSRIRRADSLRDLGAFEAAATAYADALAIAPGRTDLKVQRANMLKDSGEWAGAEQAYAEALADDPLNADIHLQMGHLNNLNGRRGVALALYRKALDLDPLLAAARLELVAAGERGPQMAAFERQMRQGGVDALIGLRARIDEMGRQLAEIARQLPDIHAAVAFPVDAFGEVRRVFDCPPPMAAHPGLSFAVVLLADAEPLEGLQLQLNAIDGQVHTAWTLSVLGADPARRAIVERAATRDGRVRWVDLAPGASLAEAEAKAARAAGRDWVVVLAPGARLHPQALAWIAAAAAETGAQAVFTDEESGELEAFAGDLRPVFRHIADRDTILEANVYGETLAISSGRVDDLDKAAQAALIPEARSRLLRALIGRHPVAHVPLPLVRIPDVRPEAPAAAPAHLVKEPAQADARICVIIPTKDNSHDLEALVEGMIALASRPETVVFAIVNNGQPLAEDPVLARLADRACVSVTPMAEPFNWSRFNNLAAAATDAPILVFANDDMVMLTPQWDQVIRTFLERPDVGAVGARLLYPDDTVQHAGILFNWRGSVIHDGLHRSREDAGPAQRWHVTRAVSAVTGAFLTTRHAHFDQVGGFDEARLAVSYSDVDYALKQRALGRRILWTPMITLHHFESKTRGLDHLDPAKAARDAAERGALEARWPGVLQTEPGMNPFWLQATLPHRLISFPSQARVWEHVLISASTNPWSVAPPG